MEGRLLHPGFPAAAVHAEPSLTADPVRVSRFTSRTTVASSACSRGALNERPLRSVATAQAKKHAAPSAVFQLAQARSSIEPSDGTT